MLAPLSHSIPAKEEVPITERASSVTLSPLFPLPHTKTPAPTPPALPSKATLPFVPEFGEYNGGPSSLPLSQIFPWDICPTSAVPSFLSVCSSVLAGVPFFSIPFLAFWAGGVRGARSGLGDLGCVRSELGASGKGCKTWVGCFRHARCGLGVWVHVPRAEQRFLWVLEAPTSTHRGKVNLSGG